MDNTAKIMIADDEEVFSKGLANLLSGEDNIKVVGIAEDGEDLIDLLSIMPLENLPDIILVDIKMPNMDGFEAMKIIKEKWPQIKLVVLSFYHDESHIKTAFELKADAFLPKERSGDEIFEIIQELMSPDFEPNNGMVKSITSLESEISITGRKKLNDKEIAVLVQIANGYRDKQISDNLCMSIHTVDKYKRQLKAKTGLEATATLTLYALKYGYIKLNY